MDKAVLSVIMPVYNEKDTITKIIEKVVALDILKELIIVDDGSTDGTREILKDYHMGDKIKVFFHDKNMGKGAAIRTASHKIRGEIVVIQDGDLEYEPKEFYELIKPITDDMADVVYGSRLWGGKPQRVHMFWHLMGNRFLTLITDILYNTTLTDIETCYKMLKTSVFKQINITSNGFSIEPEITAKVLKMKLRVYEMPISYYGRSYEEGKKITWRHGFFAIWTLVKFRFIK